MNVHRSTLFIGVGSPQGDDQIGWHVADALAKMDGFSERVSFRKAAIPLDLIDWLQGVEFLGLCDAAESSAPAGSLARWEWRAGNAGSFRELLPALERRKSQGSHDFNLSNVLDLAARLNRLPPQITVWTVSAKQFEPSTGLSECMQKQVDFLCTQIAAELSHA